MIVKKNIRKRISIALLTAALLGNSFDLPGGTLSAAEKEPGESAVSDSSAATENTAEESLANEEAEKKAPANEESDKEEPAVEDADKEALANEDTEKVDPSKQEASNAETLIDVPPKDEPENSADQAVEKEDSAAYDDMHIGQIKCTDALPDRDVENTFYDKPIELAAYEIRLFVSWNESDGKENLPGTLTWSILQGEAGTRPGTRNLVNEEDDWLEFETVSEAPGFTVKEETDENDDFYNSLTVSAASSKWDDTYDYYIRAVFVSCDEERPYTAVTTLPVTRVQDRTDEALRADKTDEEEPDRLEENNPEDTADLEQSENTTEEMAAGKEAADLSAKEASEEEPADPGLAAGSEDFLTDEENALLEKTETVTIGVSKITLNRTSATMNPAENLKLSAAITPEILQPKINWSSSNCDVAFVDGNGMVTALAEGTAEITAEYEGKTASANIEVVKTDAEQNGDVSMDAEGNVIAVSDDVWVAGFERESESLTYNGSKITQNLRIYHKGKLLQEKTDYTLTYRNNINAAAHNSTRAPSVTVTMRGQYSGSRILYFTIAPRDIDEHQTQGYEQVINYAKKLNISAPTVYYGSKKLAHKKDFVCDYSALPESYTKGDAYEEGKIYEYTVHGTGNFTGSFTMKLAVVKNKNLNLNAATAVLDQRQYTYHGEALSTKDVSIVSVKFGQTVLDASLYEYQVYADSVGTGYIEITPTDLGREAGYRGKKKINIKVVGDRSIKNAVLGEDWQSAIPYSQKKLNDAGGFVQKKANVLVFETADGKETLTEDVDYTVRYKNNKKVGTATVTFTGKGRYTGSTGKTYQIMPNTELELKWRDINEKGMPITTYKKGGAIPEFELMELSPDGGRSVLNSKTDYTVSAKNNKAPGIMTCTITGKGNYKGYKSITEVKVTSADIAQGTITASDRVYSKKTNAWKSPVTITDVNGKRLTAGTDYDKKLIYYYEGMETAEPPLADTIVYVTALGIKNYGGSSITGSYRIYNTSINKLIITIDAQEYTGKEVALSKENIHVYANRTEAKKGNEITEPCYEILKYSSNIKAGTAKVTLRGIGNYGGVRTCSFKINKKQYLTNRVTGVVLAETELFLGIGCSRQLTAAVIPEDAWNKTILWSSSNSKIAEVDTDGVVTAKNAGKVTITAKSQDTGKKAVCKITIGIVPVTGVAFNTEEIHQEEGTEYQLIATILPEDATNRKIQWESTNPDTASVNEEGKVSLKKAGMAVIKAYADERRFVAKCLVIVSPKKETGIEGDYLTPQMFRTIQDDDDTNAFNEAIKNLNENCNAVYVPAGIYLINAEESIQLKSHMNFILSEDAIIKAAPNSAKNYHIIYASNVQNVTISGGQIVGEHYEHNGSAGEWGMGIGIYDGTNISISNVNISNCFGDGIYLCSQHQQDSTASCRQIEIINCEFSNNRRNNLSIVSGDDITVDHCRFYHANGTTPEFGIDIETNNAKNPCERITISNSIFEGNAQGSIAIITAANDINVINCTLNGDFVNYAGTNVTVSNSVIRGEVNARVPIALENGTTINDGSSEEDIMIASFCAKEGPYTIGKYGIDDANAMSFRIIENSGSPSGKALRLERLSTGTKETGYYLKMEELLLGDASVLEKGVTYRFEYVIRGSGQWGIKTDQTGWYPCVPMSDQFGMGIVTYQAGSAASCNLMLYAVDRTNGMYLEVDSIKIYKVR